MTTQERLVLQNASLVKLRRLADRAAFALLPLWLAVFLPACSQGIAKSSAAADARATAVIEEYWPSHRIRVRKEVVRAPDGRTVNHGVHVEWHPNGIKRYEATYVDGKLDGVETQWHDNGQMMTQQCYERGLRQGPRYDWDPKGRKRKEENFDHDVPHGTWTIWEKDGRVKWRCEFDHGSPRT